MPTSLSFGAGSGGVGQSNVSLSASFVFAESAGSPFNFALQNANSPLRVDKVTLSSGANTITLPTSPMVPGGVVIIPPSGSTTALTLKGVSGDTGFLINPGAPTMLLFPATPTATFVINAASSVTGVLLAWL